MITSIASEVLGKYHTISLLKHWVHWEEMETSGVGARRRLSRSPELLSSHQIQPNLWLNNSAQTKVTKGVCYGLNPKSPLWGFKWLPAPPWTPSVLSGTEAGWGSWLQSPRLPTPPALCLTATAYLATTLHHTGMRSGLLCHCHSSVSEGLF